MSAFRFATLAILLLIPWSVHAQDALLDDPTWVSDSQGIYTPVENFNTPVDDFGPGFRSFGRLIVGGNIGQDKDSWQDVGIRFYDETAGEYQISFDRANQELTRGIAVFEGMAQHLWDGDGGLVNEQREWRYHLNLGGIGFEAGRMPVANMAPMAASQESHSALRYSNYFAYGYRINFGFDQYHFDGENDLTGDVSTQTEVGQLLIGPQVAIGRVVSKKRWTADARASLTVGYSRSLFKQDNSVTSGSGLIYFIPDDSHYEQTEDNIAAYAELRLATSYYLKKNWSIDLVSHFYAATPWYYSDRAVQFNLPDFGLLEPKSKYLAGAYLTLGMTYLR